MTGSAVPWEKSGRCPREVHGTHPVHRNVIFVKLTTDLENR